MSPDPVWSEQIGEDPPTVTVYERTDRDLRVYLRWQVGGKSKPMAAKTVRTIRDDRGRIMVRLQQKARKEAEEKREELLGDHTAPKRKERLTWAVGIKWAFSDAGCYHNDPKTDRHTRLAKRWLEEAGRVMDYPDWDGGITPGKIRSIWRGIRRRTQGGGGYRKAEKIVATVYRVAGALREEYPEARLPMPMKYWRAELQDEWRKTGAPIQPHRPRHTPEEAAKILRGHPEADPRVNLLVKVGAELRGGQVLRSMRGHYDPTAGKKCRRGKLGRLEVPYVSSRKRAPVLYLNWRERLALERAMRSGYLADCEQAYRAGEITDYALFPQGKLKKGKALPERATRPMNRRTLADLFTELQELVGVPVVFGRGWHGLRRGLTDVEETATTDDRVKDQVGGWAPGSTMRRGLYQMEDNPEILEAAANVREAARPRVKEAES